MTRAFTGMLLASMLLAQSETGSIAGVVRDSATGSPVADATLYLDRNLPTGQEVKADGQGRYSMANVKPGQHRLSAETPRVDRSLPTYATKMVHIAAGQEVTGIDFNLNLPARISGRVVDQNKEPIAGISVILVAREYSLGALRHVFAGMATTDDQGQYTMTVRPGRAFLLMAQKRTFRIDAVSDAPADPKLRKPAYAATFYPGTPDLEGAQTLTFRPGERRDGLDLRVMRTPSYCVEGVVQGAGTPQALAFSITDRQPTSGASGDGAMFIGSPGGKAGPEGKIRICNLYPGEYEVTAYSQDESMPSSYGSATLTIVDRDVRDFNVTARPHVAIAGEVVWDGEAPDPPVSEQLNINLRPMTRAPWRAETSYARAGMPSTFSFASVLIDSYSVHLSAVPKSAYVKEVTYAGQNVQSEPLRAGSGIGEAKLRIVLARNGGTVSARVADKDGNAISDARVLVLPISVASEAALASAIVSGQCDQNGTWTSTMMAPGKYYVLALARPHDNSPESIAKLWGSRTHFKEIELAAKGSVQVTLAPMSLD
jgi:hypothetical protein